MLPIRLDKAFTEGIKLVKRITSAQHISPPKGHAWLLLGGIIQHVTGTDSLFIKRSDKDITGGRQFQTIIDTAEGNGTYAIFNTEPSLEQSQFRLVIAVEDDELQFTGGAGASAMFEVLEWDRR